jgi:hypothetical protein
MYILLYFWRPHWSHTWSFIHTLLQCHHLHDCLTPCCPTTGLFEIITSLPWCCPEQGPYCFNNSVSVILYNQLSSNSSYFHKADQREINSCEEPFLHTQQRIFLYSKVCTLRIVTVLTDILCAFIVKLYFWLYQI